MTLNFFVRLAAAGCLLLLAASCDDGGDDAGGGGGAGGGTSGLQRQIPGLWEGRAQGVEVCFYIGDDGLRLKPNAMCNVTAPAQPDATARSYDISVDLAGTDQNGASCSFELSFGSDVVIDQATNSFRASEVQGGPEVAFSGEITGNSASGVARRDSDGSFCRIGWAAKKSSQCDDAAIQSCLDLLDCCRAILVNPVFFETCNSVALQCDQAECLRVLAGYPQCAPEPEPDPEPALEMDAGIPSAG
jgi:hypothetical protein